MKAYLNRVTAEYTQGADDDDLGRAMQELAVEMTHAGAGPYLVISTKRWATDTPEELTALLQDFSDHCEPLFARNNT